MIVYKRIETASETDQVRQCQECGHWQIDNSWKYGDSEPSIAYLNRKCKRCKSESLNYGSQNASYDMEES